MFKRVGSLLGRSVARSKTQDSLIALQVRQVASDAIKRLLNGYPEEIEKQVKVASFKNGVLSIKAPPIISAELHLLAVSLLDDINTKLGKKIIRSLKFRSG